MPLHKNKSFFLSDVLYRVTGTGCSVFFIALVISLAGTLLWNSGASLKEFGFKFISGKGWNTPFFEPLSASYRFDEQKLSIRFADTPSENTVLSLTSSTGDIISTTPTVSGRSVVFQLDDDISGSLHITIPKNTMSQNGNELGQDLFWSGEIDFDELVNSEFKDKSGVEWFPRLDDNTRIYGILPFIAGSLFSSLLSLLLAFPMALAAALFLSNFSQKFSPWTSFFAILIDLLAGIPSIIYGMWGLFFIVPIFGANLLSASLILSIMTVPYAASLMHESISLVPKKYHHAALAMGASQTSLIFRVVLPYARSGIIAGILLSLGRALGETLAVSMVIGNRNQFPTSIFEPAQTIASLIANEYGESAGLKQSALIEAGFVLIIITILFSLLGRYIIRQMNKGGSK
ncbi:MAG: phosphate ABC transporter permease subunit PstC [Brevinema sp.]